MELGGSTTAEALRKSTAHALRIAAENGLKSIAFPAVGTGVAGFPMKDCAEIMLQGALQHLQNGTTLENIYFVLFDQDSCETFQNTWKRMQASGARTSSVDGAER
jgi:O-acetyl-ADP-ribose deacetylase (regulator of RNase III)